MNKKFVCDVGQIRYFSTTVRSETGFSSLPGPYVRRLCNINKCCVSERSWASRFMRKQTWSTCTPRCSRGICGLHSSTRYLCMQGTYRMLLPSSGVAAAAMKVFSTNQQQRERQLPDSSNNRVVRSFVLYSPCALYTREHLMANCTSLPQSRNGMAREGRGSLHMFIHTAASSPLGSEETVRNDSRFSEGLYAEGKYIDYTYTPYIYMWAEEVSLMSCHQPRQREKATATLIARDLWYTERREKERNPLYILYVHD